MNKLVTASHIGVTLAFSITQTWTIFPNNLIQVNRISSAFYFFGGAADLFLSIMLWFILDEEKATAVFVDGNRVYAVTDVVKAKESLNSNDCDDEEQEDGEADSLSSSFET